MCSRTLPVWSEVLWAPGVAEILGFRWSKMGCWKNEASLFLILSHWFAFSVVLCWCLCLMFSVSFFPSCLSLASLDVLFFFWGMAVGRGEQRLGNLNAKRYFLCSLIFLNLLYCCIYVIMLILVLYISVDVKLQLPFRLWHCLSSIVIDAVTMKDTCSALQIHVSASKSSAYIFNKGFSRLLF